MSLFKKCCIFKTVRIGLSKLRYFWLLRFLLDKGLLYYIINLFHTNLCKKSLNLRNMKRDKLDSCTIAAILI